MFHSKLGQIQRCLLGFARLSSGRRYLLKEVSVGIKLCGPQSMDKVVCVEVTPLSQCWDTYVLRYLTFGQQAIKLKLNCV